MSAVAPKLLARSGDAEVIARKAIYALYTELALYPKPGLVSPIDTGSHVDMNMGTFMRSLSALRDYFSAIAQAGARCAGFVALQRLGVDAERRMLAATGGINTHRGAIFSLGLLAAAAGALHASRLSLADDALGTAVVRLWSCEILHAPADMNSHGGKAARRYGVGGARQQAAAGFPILFNIALPTLQTTLRSTGDARRARLQTLFTLMAHLDDTNVLHRGGVDGLAFIQDRARQFLSTGGVHSRDWQARALELHRMCIGKRLSPGGSADLLAAAIFVHQLQATA